MQLEQIKEWAVETTKLAKWSENKFHNFIKNADEIEFLKSQIPFFYAVQAFPRMLCKLAMNIEDSKERLLVVTNIYEEHGNGQSNKFHTETYKTYLNSLGWTEGLGKNPWVDEWIQKVLNLNYNAGQYASYLSGIEYLYALISHDVAQYLSTKILKCEQAHYANHSVLDWEHGYELLSVSLSISNQNLTDEMKEAFLNAQSDFLDMYSHLFMPTKKEMEVINKEKIAFYFIREDSSIENQILHTLKNEKLDILSIASGGEHIFEYLSHTKCSDIDAIDINPHQIELSQNKLSHLQSGDINNSIFVENEIGKFEKIFSLLRSYFNYNEIENLKSNKDLAKEKLKFIVDVLFANEHLNIVFGEEATKYTKKNFSEHFYNTFVNRLEVNEKNSLNVFTKYPIRNYEKLSQDIIKNKNNHKINWLIINPKNLETNKTYDMINISNIGDWMSLDDYKNMIILLKSHLKENGCIIARKLLGDYSLNEIFENNDLTCHSLQDQTYFYSETVVAYKISSK